MHSPLSRRQYITSAPRARRNGNRLPVHLLRSTGIVMLGITAVFGSLLMFPVLTAALLVVIAVPPGILCGTVWVQICRRYVPRLERSALPLGVIRKAWRREPVLFWLGIVGMAVLCGVSYLLVLVPGQFHSASGWGFVKEIGALYIIMLGIVEIADVLFLYRLISEQRRHRRVTERLAYRFLEQYEYHKN